MRRSRWSNTVTSQRVRSRSTATSGIGWGMNSFGFTYGSSDRRWSVGAGGGLGPEPDRLEIGGQTELVGEVGQGGPYLGAQHESLGVGPLLVFVFGLTRHQDALHIGGPWSRGDLLAEVTHPIGEARRWIE